MSKLPQLFFAPFGDGGGGELEEASDPEAKVNDSESSKEFHSRFAYGPGRGMPEVPEAKEKLAEPSLESDKEKTPEKTPEESTLRPKKPGSNVPRIVEEKRKAEKERDEFKTRLEKFEKEDKPGLEKKIADLESQIADGGHTKKEREELQDKLTAAEKKLQEREEALVNENNQLKSNLALYDIQQDPDFQQQYNRPIAEAYVEAVESFKDDPAKMNLMEGATQANNAAIFAKTPEERMRHEKRRNELLSQLSDSLDDFSKHQFTLAANAYIRATKAHALALSKHEETRKTILKERQDRATANRTKVYKQWREYSDTLTHSFDADASIEPEIADALKELKIDPSEDLANASETLVRAISANAEMEQAVDLLHKGRVYPALKAKIAGYQKLVKGLRDTITKLKGARPQSGGSGKSNSEPSKPNINERFRASREGGYRASSV